MAVGFAAVTPLNRFPALLLRAKAMASTSTSGSCGGISYTTLRERISCEREIKRSKFIAVAAPISDDVSALAFLSQVRQPRATHNCWAYKIGDQYRCNDDGEPSGTAGKPIYSAIASSGIDRVMVVVIRYFGGIKLGTGGLVRAYGGVTTECLRGAPTCLVKSKVLVGLEVPFDLLGSVYHQVADQGIQLYKHVKRLGHAELDAKKLEDAWPYRVGEGTEKQDVVHSCPQEHKLQSFQVEDIKQDYDTGEHGTTRITFRVDYDRLENLENTITTACSRRITFSV